MWARRYKARIVRRWIALLTSSWVRYMCAQLYGRRRTPEGSFVPHTRASAQYVNMGPTFIFSLARAHRCPPSSPYILTTLQSRGYLLSPRRIFPRNVQLKNKSVDLSLKRNRCALVLCGAPYVGEGTVMRRPQRGNTGSIAPAAIGILSLLPQGLYSTSGDMRWVCAP
jgi:hypothetical protein